MAIHEFPYKKEVQEDAVPTVSVILPVCRSVHTLRETIDSVLQQEYDAWELLIIIGRDISADGAGLVGHYAGTDGRIRVIEAPPPSRTSFFLNTGFRESKGKYIAIVTGDSVSDARRLGTQVAYMEGKEEVGVTQFYRRCFDGGGKSYIHRPPVSAEAMRTKLLFFNEVCLSTVMIRKSVLDAHKLLFRPEAKSAEYDFWVRMSEVTALETIPMIYGASLVDALPPIDPVDEGAHEEMCGIVAARLREDFELEVPPENLYMLGCGENVFSGVEPDRKPEAVEALQDILFDSWKINILLKNYPEEDLVTVMAAKWRWAVHGESWLGDERVSLIRHALELKRSHVEMEKIYLFVVKKCLSVWHKLRCRLDEKKTQHLAEIIRNASGNPKPHQ